MIPDAYYRMASVYGPLGPYTSYAAEPQGSAVMVAAFMRNSGRDPPASTYPLFAPSEEGIEWRPTSRVHGAGLPTVTHDGLDWVVAMHVLGELECYAQVVARPPTPVEVADLLPSANDLELWYRPARGRRWVDVAEVLAGVRVEERLSARQFSQRVGMAFRALFARR